MKTTVVLLAVLVVTVIGLRAQEIRTPIAPIAPTDVKQCSALFEAWQPILRRLHDISFDCHRRNMFKELVRYGENGVTPRPCLGVAQQSYNAHREERRQVEGCYAAVRDYDKRENEREREEKAQQAAAAAAEREQQARREQLRRESEQMQNAFAKEQRDRTEAVRQHVADQQRREAEAAQRQREQTQNTLNIAMRDLASAKDAAAAYTASAASVSHRNVDLTAGERHALDAMRRDADKGGLAPRYVPAEPTGSTVTNLSGLTGAVADLFGSEFESVVKWGLNKTETGAYMVDVYDTANDYAAKYDSFAAWAHYGQSAWSGTATYDDHVGAVTRGTEFVSGFAFAGTPGIAIQVNRTVNGVAAAHQAGLYQLQMLAASGDRMTAEQRAAASSPRAVIQGLFGSFYPLDRIHKYEKVIYEGRRVIDSHNRGFLQIFGQ
jgi:hypothetical protein